MRVVYERDTMDVVTISGIMAKLTCATSSGRCCSLNTLYTLKYDPFIRKGRKRSCLNEKNNGKGDMTVRRKFVF